MQTGTSTQGYAHVLFLIQPTEVLFLLFQIFLGQPPNIFVALISSSYLSNLLLFSYEGLYKERI